MDPTGASFALILCGNIKVAHLIVGQGNSGRLGRREFRPDGHPE